MRILPIALLSCFTAVPLMAQNGIDEPDPFGVVGEKAGDAAEGNPAPPAKTPPAPAVEGKRRPSTPRSRNTFSNSRRRSVTTA